MRWPGSFALDNHLQIRFSCADFHYGPLRPEGSRNTRGPFSFARHSLNSLRDENRQKEPLAGGQSLMTTAKTKVHVLNRQTPNGNENWRGKLIEHARQIAGYADQKSDLVGYVIIGLFSDGAHSAGARWDAERSPIPRRLLPAYIEEIVREEMINDWSENG
jgi:hypothetical protein